MSRTVAIVSALAGGCLIALQPPANASLSKLVGDFGAAFVSITISFVVISLMLLVVGHPGRLSGLSSFRPEHAIGGLGGAAIVTIGLVAVRPLGAGALIALLVGSQLIVSVVVDRFGWFGVEHVGLSATRLVGIVLVIVGTVLVTTR
jgi:bacterial/archaeal transporter family-2 protein